jgi:hypothetical protein
MATNNDAPIAIHESKETYYRDDGTTYTRSDIYVRLYVTFRDSMLRKLKGPMLSVFLCIALHCDETMSAWPSLSRIQEETGYSHPAVLRAISDLEAMGLIERTARTKKSGDADSNSYRVRGFASMGEVGNHVTNPQVTTLPTVGNHVTTKNIPSKNNHIEHIGDSKDESHPPTLPGIEAPTPKATTPRELILAVATVSKVNLSLATVPQRSQVTQTAKLLHQKAQADADQVAAFATWWYAVDWRGRQGDPPTPAQIRENWQKWQDAQQAAPAAYGMRVVQM